MLASLTANALVDYLTPVDFDGQAHISLGSDRRLALDQLVEWEADNLVQLLDRLPLVQLKLLLAGSDARDALARLVQYALLALKGVLALAPAASTLTQQLQAIIQTLVESRRTGRWLKGVDPLLSLRNELSQATGTAWVGTVPSVVAKVSMLGHLLTDHQVWLQKARVLGGSASAAQARSLRLLCVSRACALVHLCLRTARTAEARARLRRLADRLAGAPGDAGEEAAERPPVSAELRQAVWECVRELLLLLQAVHVAGVLRSHDALAGLMGVCTGVHDLRRMYRDAVGVGAAARTKSTIKEYT